MTGRFSNHNNVNSVKAYSPLARFSQFANERQFQSSMSTQNLRMRNANSTLIPYNTVSLSQSRRSNNRTPNPVEENNI